MAQNTMPGVTLTGDTNSTATSTGIGAGEFLLSRSGNLNGSESFPMQLTGHKLNGKNYLEWAQSIKLVVDGKGRLGYITGETKEPKKTDPTWKTWKSENSLVMSWLINSMEVSIGRTYLFLPTAKDVWDAVRETYSDLKNSSQIFELKTRLWQTRQGDRAVSEYYNEMKALWQELDLCYEDDWACMTDSVRYLKRIEDDRVYEFLAGLNKSLDEVRGRILGRIPLPSIREVFSEVRREEGRRKVMLGEKTVSAPEISALMTGTNHNNSPYQARQNKKGEKVWCDHCHKPRHTRETCWDLHGKPPNWKPRNFSQSNRDSKAFHSATEENGNTATTATTPSFSKEQLEQLYKLFQSTQVTNPVSSSCSLAQKGTYQSAVFNVSTIPLCPWIIDSGSTDHMTGCSKIFSFYSPCAGNQKIKIADGSLSAIAGKGSIVISNTLILHNVLHVPNLSCNLLSVSKITHDLKCCAKFLPNCCEFQELDTGRMIGSAREYGGLYYFDDGNSMCQQQKISNLGACFSSTDDNIMLWHRSKIKMVNDLLEGVHLIASVEAISLGVQFGIHPWVLYDIISNAAGNSWIFKNHIPNLLRGNAKLHFLNAFIQNLGIALDMAKTLAFPLPLLAVAHQQLILGLSHAHANDDNPPLVKVWENVLGVNITDTANLEAYKPEELAKQITAKSNSVTRVGFIGLGAMGFGMATHLLRSNFTVVGYDVYRPTLTKFQNVGGLIANSPAEAAKDVGVLVIMVTNEAQAESVLYGDLGAVPALSSGASIILSSTVSPGFVSQLERRLQFEGKDLKLVDAPVSGGVKRASMGELTIMAAGTDESLKSTGSVLSALSEKLYVIKGGCGAGSGVKMANQLLAGVHIASAAEAMAFGARLGLNTRVLFNIITNSGGSSWMFENRVPHMLDNDYTPYSALDIFVKDMGIIARECSSQRVPLHISTIAHQLFLAGSAAGWGRQDDSAVVKVYETLSGVKVEGRLPVLKKEAVLQSLPSEWPLDPFDDIKGLIKKNAKTLIVLDDDPTGTQTVHGIEVLTEWSVASLVEQFRKKPLCFFILTNSRALSSEKARSLITDICRNLRTAANSVENTEYTVVLRGDSTLRGHFPEEADAAVSVLGEMDAWIICPFFFQGGRYTIEDVHYVGDLDRLVPAGDTEFAKDASFGFKSSNLREWVEEKTSGRIPASSVASISIQLLRKGGPDAVCERLCSLQKGSTCIVNAASERDIAVFAAGMIQAELKGKSFLCRTAASFVSARIGIVAKAPILPKDLGNKIESTGGLIVVGSYVPKTTKQVEELISQSGHFIRSVEVSVDKVAMKSSEERQEEIIRAAEMVDVFLQARKDTLLITSRVLITGKTPSESLEINLKVSSAMVEIVRRITTRPRYILAKGGITSSDIATKALEAKRAKVVGQALAGVPLWELGPESRHPGVPYVVFPGNVGDNNAVANVVRSWARPVRISSTKELLLNAEKGEYAVGAFNVYNMEGVEAVVAAAEEERSPAILQIHPSALKEGGFPLVACCVSAAEHSSVPITVHFDHGTSKLELMEAIVLGFDSVMVDGSHLPFKDNISHTKYISFLAHSKGMLVEAELGRLSGTEDGLTVEDYEAKLTDVNQAEEFIDETDIDALAVCIGNVHGKYPSSGPNLRLDLLKDLHALSSKKGVLLVLHGASGLSAELIKGCIERGVRKFNVNTEVRKAYMDSLSRPKSDLIHLMASAKEAMKAVVAEKMRLFGSSGKA